MGCDTGEIAESQVGETWDSREVQLAEGKGAYFLVVVVFESGLMSSEIEL
jgi:hypothetical protein